MAEVRLRPWRLKDADDVAVMIEDEHLRPWSAMAVDLESWIRREISEARALRERFVYRTMIVPSGASRCACPGSRQTQSAGMPFTTLTSLPGS